MKTLEYKGYTAKITVHHDDTQREPWKESDGHGVVTDWVHRDKKPGEWLLNSDRGSKRFYDHAESTVIAKRDGWGLGADQLAALTKTLDRKPTRKQIIAEAVRRDYEFLRGWCNDEWHYQGYTTEIVTPDGEVLDGDSCWGFDGTDAGEKYMIGEAISSARHSIDTHIALMEQTAIAECCP